MCAVRNPSKEDELSIVVTGPGVEGRKAATPLVGVSLAITFATRDIPPGAFYVREGNTLYATVERHADKSVTITKARVSS